MAVAYRASASTGYSSSTTSRVVTKPTGTVADDILIAWIYVEDTTKTLTVPSGWTRILNPTNSTNYLFYVYWLRAGGSEPANYTWSWTGNIGATGTIATYSGCITSGNPYDGTPQHAETTGFGTYPAVSDTTTVANTILVYGCTNINNAASTNPTGTTERIDSGGVAVSDKAQAAVGATGSINATNSDTAMTSTLVILKPPGATTTAPPPYQRTLRFWNRRF